MSSLIAKNHPSFIKRTGATYSAAAAVWANTAAKQVGRILREQHSGTVCPLAKCGLCIPMQQFTWHSRVLNSSPFRIGKFIILSTPKTQTSLHSVLIRVLNLLHYDNCHSKAPLYSRNTRMDSVTSIPKWVLKGRLFKVYCNILYLHHLFQRLWVWIQKFESTFSSAAWWKEKRRLQLEDHFVTKYQFESGNLYELMNHFTIDTFHGIFQIVTKQQQRSVNGWNLPNLGACWNQESSPRIEWAIVVASHFLSVTWIAVEEIKTIWWIDIIMSSLNTGKLKL